MTTTVVDGDYKDMNGVVQATKGRNVAGDGYILERKYTETIRYVKGDAVTYLAVDTAGDVDTTVIAANGVKDAYRIAGATGIVTMSVHGHAGVADAQVIKDVYTDANGNIDARAVVAGGFNQADLYLNTDGTAAFTLGQDKFSFAANTLQSTGAPALPTSASLNLPNPNSGITFGLASAAVGFVEDISWNPATGHALLNLKSNATGHTFSTSLGQVNPGDTLKVASNSLIELVDANNHVLLQTQISSTGGQTDTTYNADGTVATVVNYDAAGNRTGGTILDGDYKDTKGVVQATKGTNAAGDGYVLDRKTVETIRYVKGDTVTALAAVGTDGSVNVDVKATNGVVDSFNLNGSTGVMKLRAGSDSISVGNHIDDVYADASGNLDIHALAGVGGFGETDLTLATDGSSNFTLGQDKIAFAVGVLQGMGTPGLANPNNGITFGLISAVGGLAEDISWNPLTGKALLNLTNIAAGTTFSSFLGRIDPGDTLKVLSKTQFALLDTAGHTLNTTQVNSDGSQVDTTYNADGTVASTLSYDNKGNLVSSTGGNGGIVNYTDSNGNLVAFGEAKADGSGYVYFEQGDTLRYGAGALQQPISVVQTEVTLVAANGQKDIVDGLGGPAQYIRHLDVSMNIGGNSYRLHMFDANVHDATIDKNGNFTITTGAQNFGLGVTTVNTDGTGSYTLGGDKIVFADFNDQFDPSNAAFYLADGQNIAFAANSIGFTAGVGTLDFDPMTGHVGVVASNFSQKLIDIGQINPGDTMKVSALVNNVGTIDLLDASGHVLEETTLNADFTTKVQTFSANGSVASTLNYDKYGNQVAALTASIASFGAASGVTGSTVASHNVTNPLVLAAAH